jgi:hypothetical protein
MVVLVAGGTILLDFRLNKSGYGQIMAVEGAVFAGLSVTLTSVPDKKRTHDYFY